MTIKSTDHEIYQVAFSLGTDCNNVVWELHILGEPTISKVKGFFTQLITNMQGRVCFATGLPSRDCLKYQQCLFLLNRFGLPPLGLAHQCVNNDFGHPFIMGHISSMKIGSVYEIDEQS